MTVQKQKSTPSRQPLHCYIKRRETIQSNFNSFTLAMYMNTHLQGRNLRMFFRQCNFHQTIIRFSDGPRKTHYILLPISPKSISPKHFSQLQTCNGCWLHLLCFQCSFSLGCRNVSAKKPILPKPRTKWTEGWASDLGLWQPWTSRSESAGCPAQGISTLNRPASSYPPGFLGGWSNRESFFWERKKCPVS